MCTISRTFDELNARMKIFRENMSYEGEYTTMKFKATMIIQITTDLEIISYPAAILTEFTISSLIPKI